MNTDQGTRPSCEQEEAFQTLFDTETASLKHPIGSDEALRAVAVLNRATSRAITALADVNRYAVGCTICQGACLIAGVFRQLGVLESAWCGPASELSKKAVRLLPSITGRSALKVRFLL